MSAAPPADPAAVPGLTRRQVPGGTFLFGATSGLVTAAAALFEGSAAWAVFVWASGLLGLAGGLAAGPTLRDQLRQAAAAGAAPTRWAQTRGMLGARSLLGFWVPQLLFWYASYQVALALGPPAAPRSLADGKFPVVFECLTTYFAAIAGAWYHTWQWSRTLPKG